MVNFLSLETILGFEKADRFATGVSDARAVVKNIDSFVQEQTKTSYSTCSLWVVFAGLFGSCFGGLMFYAYLQDAHEKYEEAADYVQYSIYFLSFSVFTPMAMTDLYNDSLGNRFVVTVLAITLSSGVGIYSNVIALKNYRNGYEHYSTRVGRDLIPIEQLPEFINLTVAHWWFGLDIGECPSEAGDVNSFILPVSGLLHSTFAQKNTARNYGTYSGFFAKHSQEWNYTPFGKEQASSIFFENGTLFNPFNIYQQTIAQGVPCETFGFENQFSIPINILTEKTCSYPFTDTTVCVWEYWMDFSLSTEFLQSIPKAQDFRTYIYDSSFSNSNQPGRNSNKQWAGTNGKITLNSTYQMYFEITWHMRKPLRGNTRFWWEVNPLYRRPHETLSEEAFRYVIVPNKLSVNLEIPGVRNGRLLVDTKISFRTSDFSDLLVQMIANSTVIIGLMALFFPNMLPMRRKCF